MKKLLLILHFLLGVCVACAQDRTYQPRGEGQLEDGTKTTAAYAWDRKTLVLQSKNRERAVIKAADIEQQLKEILEAYGQLRNEVSEKEEIIEEGVFQKEWKRAALEEMMLRFAATLDIEGVTCAFANQHLMGSNALVFRIHQNDAVAFLNLHDVDTILSDFLAANIGVQIRGFKFPPNKAE